MENEYIITSDRNLVSRVELYHWGIKGMKWGVRRYQNKDGSLTNAGRKRYAKLEAEMKALKPKKVSKAQKAAETEKAARKKLVSEMTDDEVRERTNRMRLEKEYYDAAHNLAVANPQKVSAGKKFMNSLVNEVIAPAAKVAGREWAEKFMKEKLGLNKKDVLDPVAKLEKEAKKLKAEKEIEEYKSEIKKLKNKKKDEDKLPEVKTWDDLEKKRKYLEAINNSGNNSNNQNNNNNNNNKNNNSNNNSGNNNQNNNSNNNSNNNNNSKPQQQTANNTNKAPEQKPVTSTSKVKDVDYYSKEYEKEVDRLLAEIDDYGWELYEKYYK